MADKPDMTCKQCSEEVDCLVEVTVKFEHSFAADSYVTGKVCLRCFMAFVKEDTDEHSD